MSKLWRYPWTFFTPEFFQFSLTMALTRWYDVTNWLVVFLFLIYLFTILRARDDLRKSSNLRKPCCIKITELQNLKNWWFSGIDILKKNFKIPLMEATKIHFLQLKQSYKYQWILLKFKGFEEISLISDKLKIDFH